MQSLLYVRKAVIGDARQAVQEQLALPVMVEAVHTIEANVESIVQLARTAKEDKAGIVSFQKVR